MAIKRPPLSPTPPDAADAPPGADVRRLALSALPILVGLAAVGALAAFFAAKQAENEYTAAAYAIYYPIPVPEAPAPSDPSVPAASQYQGRALEVIAGRVTARVDEPGAGAVLDKVATDFDMQASLLTIEASDTDAEHAAELANEFAREYVRYWAASDRRRLEIARELVAGRLSGLTRAERHSRRGRRARQRLGEIERLFTRSSTGAAVAKRARVPEEPSSASPASRALAGGALGLLLGLAVVALLERRSLRRLAAGA